MTTIDQKVVEMKFDNKQFEAGVKQTMTSLENLNKGLKLEGATRGITELNTAAKGVNLAGLEAGVNGLADKFKAMSIVAITALTTIAHQAVIAGQTLVKSLTIDPVKTGLSEYETNLNSIQTILSNTQWQNTGLKDVTNALQILNEYSDQTIYNFAEMARNIGTFTAAGVKLEVAVEAIKGIANLAAISGSNSQQAATAMYQLSQALAAGKVALIDWNSVVNAGMGGKVFQDALMETARVHGVAIDKIIKDAGSFRNSLETGWLTSGILTETLSKFTGDLTAQQLKTMGYTEQQIVGILKMGKTAQDAATKVKTFSALINTLQESATSGWARTWELILGDFDEAKELFTGVNNVLGGFIEASADARNKVIGDWKELGGRAVIIQSIENVFTGLMSVLAPIRDAFRDIFPATTGKQLYELSILIRNFTDGLRLGSENADRLRRTFAGVFAIFGIGWDIVKEAAKTLFELFGIASEGSGDILEVTASIGDFLVELRKAIKEGNAITKVFGAIKNVLEVPIKLLVAFAGYLSGLFDGFDAQAAVKGITGFVAGIEPLTRMGELVANVWGKTMGVLDDVWKFFLKLGSNFAGFFGEFGQHVTEALQGIDFGDVLGAINTGLFAGLLLMIQNIFGGGGKGIFGSIRESFDQLTDTMQTMQTTLRAATLLQIAAAIGILTISVNTLSKIDAAGLTRALTAITVMFGQLIGVLLIFEKMSGFAGLAKMPIITAGLILLGFAVNVLASAVEKLAGLSWEELAKGLTGTTVLLGTLVGVVQLMPPAPGLIATSSALILLGGAVKILASAVGDLAGHSWEDLAKGLIGVGAVLTGLALFTKFAAVEKGGLLSGAGIVLLAAGIKILASAMGDFASLSWENIGKSMTALLGSLTIMAAALIVIPPTAPIAALGILGVAISIGMIAEALAKMGAMSWADIGAGLTAMLGAFTIIALALTVIPPTAPIAAAGILIVALSLGMIVDALKGMAGMSWEQIAKGLITLAGALGIIAIAMNVMTGALPGAAALLVVAASLAVLAPILQMFGQMSWEEMGKGLLLLAGIFVVLGLAALVLQPVIPALLGLGIAIALIGVGLALAGVGILAFSVAVTALSISGAALVATLVAIVAGLIGLIPMLAEQIGLGLIVIAGVIGNAGPAITKAVANVLIALLDAIIQITPKLGEAILKLLLEILDILEGGVPRLIEVGLKLLLAFLRGIRDNIREITNVAGDILVQFIKGMQDNQPKILRAGADFIISYIENLAKTIRENSERLGAAGGDLAAAIIEGMAKGLSSGANKVTQAAKNVAKNALNAALDFLGIKSPSKEFEWVGQMSDEGLAKGLTKYSGVVTSASEDVGKTALTTITKTLSGLGNAVSGDIDMTPVITPVLDLSLIRKDAETIGSMFRTTPISLEGTIRSAKDASAGFEDNRQTATDNEADSRGGDTIYNQYNTSPKALSSAEIYRQTKNQLSKAKEATTP